MKIYLLGCRHDLHISGYSDGIYYWPESLLHYLTHYAVRLPNEFTEHVRPLPTFPTATVAAVDENTETDFTWWKTQQGSSQVLPLCTTKPARNP
ncbi:hypothetical protein [Hymenobacter sp. APR13]|uniref:hypothetical protein n=1 Tax=Hymenobacter sp. APR13 TaxID=1356852 RepID=UPI0012E06F7A|nr:hypothetical protein [Hymenobacter sp. APR13]